MSPGEGDQQLAARQLGAAMVHVPLGAPVVVAALSLPLPAEDLAALLAAAQRAYGRPLVSERAGTALILSLAPRRRDDEAPPATA